MASSLVGVTIRALMYPTAAALKYLWIIGSKKAAVFPEPVIELATISFPDIITGTHNCWMRVGLVYYTSLIAFIKGLISRKS